MHGWKAYYVGDRVFSSADTDWEALPATGVVGIIVYEEPPYRRLILGGDWYYLDDGVPATTETHDEWGEWVTQPDDVAEDELKRGELIPDDAFERLQSDMMADREWPAQE